MSRPEPRRSCTDAHRAAASLRTQASPPPTTLPAHQSRAPTRHRTRPTELASRPPGRLVTGCCHGRTTPSSPRAPTSETFAFLLLLPEARLDTRTARTTPATPTGRVRRRLVRSGRANRRRANADRRTVESRHRYECPYAGLAPRTWSTGRVEVLPDYRLGRTTRGRAPGGTRSQGLLLTSAWPVSPGDARRGDPSRRESYERGSTSAGRSVTNC